MSYFSPHRPTFSNEYLVFLRELSSNLTSKAQTFKSVCQGGGGGGYCFLNNSLLKHVVHSSPPPYRRGEKINTPVSQWVGELETTLASAKKVNAKDHTGPYTLV